MIDIGANLTDKSFADDLDVVLDDAKNAGLAAIVVTGTDVALSQHASALALRHHGFLYSTVGVHPHHADDVKMDWQSHVWELANHKHVVAIGETGLDYYRNFSKPNTQQDVFVQHLQIASELNMPLFIHDRESRGDMARLLEQHLGSEAVVHCFTGTRNELETYLNLGCYIGITGWICDERRGQELTNLLPMIPLDRLMVETDSPYLLPRTIRPKPRSRRNEPRFLTYVVERIATILNKSSEEVATRTAQNARRLFSLQ